MNPYEVTPDAFAAMVKGGMLRHLQYSEWAALATIAHAGASDPVSIATRAGMPLATAYDAVRSLRTKLARDAMRRLVVG